MREDLVNEINQNRADKLLRAHNNAITDAVRLAVEEIDPRALEALQGIDAEEDNVTHALWTQAVTAADMNGTLVMADGDPDGDIISHTTALKLVAYKVALAILVVNGLAEVEV